MKTKKIKMTKKQFMKFYAKNANKIVSFTVGKNKYFADLEDNQPKTEETEEQLITWIENKDNFPMTDMIKLGFIRKLFHKNADKAREYIPLLQKMQQANMPQLQSAATNLIKEMEG